MPNEGQNVVVTLADGSERLAYWRDGAWWEGVDDDPNDRQLTQTVTGWREA